MAKQPRKLNYRGAQALVSEKRQDTQTVFPFGRWEEVVEPKKV